MANDIFQQSPDNSGNILCELDYQNIILVDPNKTIDDNSNVAERLVDHENLVMYANLEAQQIPRTRLAVGGSPEDVVRNISIAEINFLRPGVKNPNGPNFLTNEYTDEITGKNSVSGEAINQRKERIIQNSNNDYYYINELVDKNNNIDTGLLGITSIRIKTGMSFIPTVTMELEDIQGRALFEKGEQSPYAVFFNLPYPQFYLTIKGYYGQAVRYQLALETFNARFNTQSGNYMITLVFRGFKYNILNEIKLGYLLAAPHMYATTYKISPSTPTQGEGSAQNSVGNTSGAVRNVISEGGYQKIHEVYSEYKSKGLLPADFPELTLSQLIKRMDRFELLISNSMEQADLGPLTDAQSYLIDVENYAKDVYSTPQESWFDKYIDTSSFLVLSKNNQRVYRLKKQFREDSTSREKAISELKAIIVNSNRLLKENLTFGDKGTSPIQNSIDFPDFIVNAEAANVDWEKTYIEYFGSAGTALQIETFRTQLVQEGYFDQILETDASGNINSYNIFFVFEGADGTFLSQINQMIKLANSKKTDIEQSLALKLSKLVESKSSGIGFKPSIRNFIAVIMANTEGFIRLMSDVHRDAYESRNSPVRQNVIKAQRTSASNQDRNEDSEVYPWPQFFVEVSEGNAERFQLKYIGDPAYRDLTQSYNTKAWPEVAFVEEFMRGSAETLQRQESTAIDDEVNTVRRITVNALEFPQTNAPYLNKEEIKYFFEIWERFYMLSHYTRLSRETAQTSEIYDVMATLEADNIVTSLGESNPYLINKLKQYDFNSANYVNYLSTISNEGKGVAIQQFIRDYYVTGYIQAITENTYELFDGEYAKSGVAQVNNNSKELDKLISYIASTKSDSVDVTDTYPFVINSWTQENLQDGLQSGSVENVYNTSRSIYFNEDKKLIANFTTNTNLQSNRPVTSFGFNDPVYPQIDDFTEFYDTRSPYSCFITEGSLNYYDYDGNTTATQTASIMNTPYFTNAIQQGTYDWLNGQEYPFIQGAYLLLNSLPLATVSERYKTSDEDTKSYNDLNYIFASFRKYGAIHKLPYAWILKYGSIWHRYKTYINTGTDILDTVWSGQSYLNNYDPITNDIKKRYEIVTNGETYSIVLADTTVDSLGTTETTTNVGFYPRLMNDYYVFLNGYNLFATYTSEDIQSAIDRGELYVGNVLNQNIFGEDTNDTNRTVSVSPWSTFVKRRRTNNEYFILPSMGGIPSIGDDVTQIQSECFANGDMILEVSGNTNIYDGTVRTFWGAPTYGYYETDKVTKPQYNEYMKVLTQDIIETVQHAFAIDGYETVSPYKSIEDVFGVFERGVLDLMEQEFLNFSKPVYSLSTTNGSTRIGVFNVDQGDQNRQYKNFQLLIRSILLVQNVGSNDFSDLVNELTQKQFANITNTLSNFMEYDVVLKLGNPSQFNRRLFNSFSSQPPVDKISFSPYVPGTLPGDGVTVAQSRALNTPAWNALDLYVGFSNIEGIAYPTTAIAEDSASFITDFFIDNNIAFTESNVIQTAPLIKMYATQKYLDNDLNAAGFTTLIDNLRTTQADFQSNSFNSMFVKVRKNLPLVDAQPVRNNPSIVTGTQLHSELYEQFKAINDKWIAGYDYSNKTLFEDILFLDRASRNIGDTVIADIYDLKNYFNSLNVDGTVQDYITGILTKNHFVVMPMPAYINFYNVQNVSQNVTPKIEGSLDFANKMWGTYLNVDTRATTSKLVCFYVDRPSEILDMNENSDFRFRNDGFDLRRASDNPLLEDQTNKTDWALSNRVVGFNVDVGIRNQNVFHGFTVSQEPGKATAESLQALDNMISQANGKNTNTQNVSLYSIYKTRSYQSTVQCLGNAMIQPTMYYNLRHVPMFNGAYMIMDVEHIVSPGQFETTFTGMRQPVIALSTIDNYIQQLNQNLLTKIVGEINQKRGQQVQSREQQSNDINKTQEASQPQNNSQTSPPNTCNEKLNVEYETFLEATVTQRTHTYQEVYDIIVSSLDNEAFNNLTEIQKTTLTYLVFGTLFIENGDSSAFNSKNYNIANINLEKLWGGNLSNYFTEEYFCATFQSGNIKPMASFEFLEDNIYFAMIRLKDRVLNMTTNAVGVPTVDSESDVYIKYWPRDNSLSDEQVTQVKTTRPEIVTKFGKANDLVNELSGTQDPTTNTTTNTSSSVFEELATITKSEIPYISNNNPYGTESFSVQLKPNVGLWDIFIFNYGYKTIPDDPNVVELGGGDCSPFVLNRSNYISSDKQSIVEIDVLYDLVIADVLGEDVDDLPPSEFRGQYLFQFEMAFQPINSDGSLDTSRTQKYQRFDIFFKL
jgi:hypothetical protein